jgi:hypothetical protein
MAENEKYVVRGARIRCEFGTLERQLDMQEDHGVYVCGLPQMHELDCVRGVNIPCFGTCSKLGGACDPSLSGYWRNVATNLHIDKKKALTTESYLVCLRGRGAITFLDSG